MQTSELHNRQLLRLFVLDFLAPHKIAFVRIGLFMLLSVGLQLPGPLLTMYVIDRVLPNHGTPLLNQILILLIALIAARCLFSFLNESVTIQVKERIILEVQQRLITHIQKLPLSFFAEKQSPYLQSRIMNDARSIDGALVRSLVALLLNVLLFVAGMVFVAIIYLPIGLILIFGLAPFAYIRYFANERMRALSRDLQETTAQASACVAERFAGNRLIKAYLQEDIQGGIASEYLESLRQQYVKTNMFGVLSSVGTGFVAALTSAGILYYAAVLVMAGRISLGQMVAVLSMLSFFFQPINEFVSANLKFQQSVAAIRRIYEFLLLTPERVSGLQLPRAVKGRIEFRNVRFGYRPNRDVLQDVSFLIEPGAHVALAGRTGAGKTTLVNLLLGFYPVSSGRIEIDGFDIGGLALGSLRERIGIVDQNAFLFSGSVRENVRMGKPSATPEEIVTACIQSGAHEFVAQLPAGYDTPVGERGIRLSGGQCQKIALARIFLKDPAILILDEAVSSIDSQSESVIQQVLRRLMSGRTTIIVAHRLSSVLLANEVVLLENGRIVERGTHELLQEIDGSYAALFADQFEAGISRKAELAKLAPTAS